MNKETYNLYLKVFEVLKNILNQNNIYVYLIRIIEILFKNKEFKKIFDF